MHARVFQTPAPFFSWRRLQPVFEEDAVATQALNKLAACSPQIHMPRFHSAAETTFVVGDAVPLFVRVSLEQGIPLSDTPPPPKSPVLVANPYQLAAQSADGIHLVGYLKFFQRRDADAKWEHDDSTATLSSSPPVVDVGVMASQWFIPAFLLLSGQTTLPVRLLNCGAPNSNSDAATHVMAQFCTETGTCLYYEWRDLVDYVQRSAAFVSELVMLRLLLRRRGSMFGGSKAFAHMFVAIAVWLVPSLVSQQPPPAPPHDKELEQLQDWTDDDE